MPGRCKRLFILSATWCRSDTSCHQSFVIIDFTSNCFATIAPIWRLSFCIFITLSNPVGSFLLYALPFWPIVVLSMLTILKWLFTPHTTISKPPPYFSMRSMTRKHGTLPIPRIDIPCGLLFRQPPLMTSPTKSLPVFFTSDINYFSVTHNVI